MKPVVIVAGVGPGIGTSIARAFGAERFAARGTAFDPDDIAAAFVRLHRGTNTGVEIHFAGGEGDG